MDVNNTVDQVSKMAETVSQYGPAIVILSVFLIMFLILFFALVHTNQKHMDRMAKQNDEIFNRIFTSLPAKDYDEEDIVEIFTRLNDVFKEECKRINEKTKSSRTAIYVFHNGTVASHGLPFFKMTCVSEWISRSSGFSEQMSKHTNLNLALFSSLITELHSHGEYIISDCGNMSDIEPYTYTFMSTRAKTSIFICVYDSNNRIMAFINTEFKECVDRRDLENIRNIIRDSCAKIQPVLEFSSYKSKNYI